MYALEDQLNNRKTQDDSVFLRIDQSLVDVRDEDQKLFHQYLVLLIIGAQLFYINLAQDKVSQDYLNL